MIQLYMNRKFALQHLLGQSRLISVAPAGLQSGMDLFADFIVVPLYRCYLQNPNKDIASEPWVAPQPADLVAEPEYWADSRGVGVYVGGILLGYLSREDNLLTQKLIRRHLPICACLIGFQPKEGLQKRFSLEIAVLYPAHPATLPAMMASDNARVAGLRNLGSKPFSSLKLSRDPLSAGHVHPDYYWPYGDLPDQEWESRRKHMLDLFRGAV